MIADDVFYYDEPYYQDGILAQAVNAVTTANNVSYFALAGNLGSQAYESANVSFTSATIPTINASPQAYYNFNPTGTAATQQQVTLNQNQRVQFSLEWDQPYYSANGVTSTLTMYLLNDATKAVVASATANAVANQTPYQYLTYANPAASAKFDVVIGLATGPAPGRLKYVNYGANSYGAITFNTFATNSPTLIPHSAAAGATSVAAVPFYDHRNPESYTSAGPATVLFAADGTRLAAADVRAKPDLAAPDGVDNTVLGSDSDGNGYKNFFGTSCATPNAAAVAALVRSANPSLSPAAVAAVLKGSADPAIGAANPNLVGRGLVDAYRAVVAATAAPAATPVADGFESGYLNAAWTTYTSGNGRVSVQSANAPSSGTYQLVEDVTTAFNYSAAKGYYSLPQLDEAVLHVNAANLANVALTFDEKEFRPTATASIDPDYAMPASFTGHGNYQGVAFSVDGTTWYRAVSLTGTASTTAYQTQTVNLSSAAAAAGVTLTADTQVKFQYFNAYSVQAPFGGFAFDNVGVIGQIVAGPLNLTGPVFTLRRNADGQRLDVYTAAAATGTPSQSVPIASVSSVTVTGTGAASSLTLDLAGGYPLPASVGLTDNGTGSGATLTVLADAAGDTVAVGGTLVSVTTAAGTLPVTASNVGTVTFAGGAGPDVLQQTAAFAGAGGARFTNTGSTDTLTVTGGTFTFPAPAAATAPVPFTLGTVTVGAGATVALANPATPAGRAALVLSSLSLAGPTNAPTGRLDLGGNDLVLLNGSAAMATAWAAAGFAGGTWTGQGITSSAAAADATRRTAVGVLPNAAPGGGTVRGNFDGVAVDATAVLLKYTYYGDANLDGVVSAADYTRADAGFVNGLTGWANGDANYDGVVDGSDYSLIDTVFNTQTAPIA